MSEQTAPAPIITDTRRVNAPFFIGGADEQGNREISFIVGQNEIQTFIISRAGAAEMLRGFSGGIETAVLTDIPKEQK